jgi:hypothetical protein
VREAEVLVHGDRGTAVLEYPTDRLAYGPGVVGPGDAGEATPAGRTVLLANLLDHRADPAGTPLLSPFQGTRSFTATVEAIVGSPAPTPIPGKHLTEETGSGSRTITLHGVDQAVREAATRMALFSEVGAAWATPGTVTQILGR